MKKLICTWEFNKVDRTLILIGRIYIIIFIIIYIPQRQTNRIKYVGKFIAVLPGFPNQKIDSHHFNKA